MDADLSSIVKYPSTEHLEDSRLGEGDSEKGRAKLAWLAGCWIVAEEKLDGGNSGVSFVDGRMELQSRGHFLAGGGDEAQFSILKSWAAAHEDALRGTLGDRYVMYGENMRAVHSVHYDRLPHVFMEFDVWDKERSIFLSTHARQLLLAALPVVQAPVLYEGWAPSRMGDLKALVGGSLCRSADWRASFEKAALRAGVDPSKAWADVDRFDQMEGLYFKVETRDGTVARFKWVRPTFVQTIAASGKHWKDRPMIFNALASEVDLYDPEVSWECPGLFGRDGMGGFKAWASEPPEEARAPAFPARRIKP